MRDPTFQHSVLLQADSIIIFRRFMVFVQLRDGKGGIRPKEPHQVSLCIAGDDGSQKRFPSIGTMDVAMAQDAALQMTKLKSGSGQQLEERSNLLS